MHTLSAALLAEFKQKVLTFNFHAYLACVAVVI